MRTPSAKAKAGKTLQGLIATTAKLWRPQHLTYDQTRYVGFSAQTHEIVQ